MSVFDLATLLALFIGIGLHEYAHCKVADMSGDPTARYQGRVTLNLFKHFDPLGALMILVTTLSGFGIGWGRPAPMDPSKMRDPRWDFFAAVLAGPVSNLVQALLYAVTLRVWHAAGAPVPFLTILFLVGVVVNVRLCFFNLIPLGPLDGHWLLGLLMPERTRYKWFVFNRNAGMYVLFALILGGQFLSQAGIPSPLSVLVGAPSRMVERLLLPPSLMRQLGADSSVRPAFVFRD